jgi:hypothetical protein
MERDWTHAGIEEAAYAALAEGLAASELWSLLLGVAEQRAAQRSAADVRRQWEKDRFVCPSYVDQRTLNLLALESARRLRKNCRQVIKLTTNHRCVRAQAVPKHAGYAAHFRLFCIASAGHERKDQGFLVESLSEHIQTHLAALNRLEQHGYGFPDRSLKILATPERKALGERIASGVRSLEGTSVVFETLTHNYYDGLRFMISARPLSGERMPLID